MTYKQMERASEVIRMGCEIPMQNGLSLRLTDMDDGRLRIMVSGFYGGELAADATSLVAFIEPWERTADK